MRRRRRRHRTSLDGDALAAQVSTGALEHILFPPDPVASARPSCIRSRGLPALARFVRHRAHARIGWGRPVSFITAQIGVIVSLPDPKIAIIGRGRLHCPRRSCRSSTTCYRVAEVDSERFFMRVTWWVRASRRFR